MSDESEIADYCPQCGALIDSRANGYVTKSGDMYCVPCGREMDRLDRAHDEADAIDCMDDPAA